MDPQAKPTPETHVCLYLESGTSFTPGWEAPIELPPLTRSATDKQGRTHIAQTHSAVVLIPGRNFVLRDYWAGLQTAEHETVFGERIRTHEKTLARLASRIRVSTDLSDFDRRPGPDAPRTLRDVDPEHARELIRDCDDRKTLIRWRDAARGETALVDQITRRLSELR